MQPTSISTKDGKRVWSSEIWAMYQLRGGAISKFQNSKQLFTKKIKIISAWRYPGVSPKNNPIPEDILREIEDLA